MELDTIDQAIDRTWTQLTAARLLKNQAAAEHAQTLLNKLLDQRIETIINREETP